LQPVFYEAAYIYYASFSAVICAAVQKLCAVRAAYAAGIATLRRIMFRNAVELHGPLFRFCGLCYPCEIAAVLSGREYQFKRRDEGKQKSLCSYSKHAAAAVFLIL